jgi:predicted ArsR family transcriptional regulator
MKITKSQLKQIIREELEEGGPAGHYDKDRDYDWKVDAEIGDKLVNAILDLQELRGDAYVVKMLREMADDIEREASAGPAL